MRELDGTGKTGGVGGDVDLGAKVRNDVDVGRDVERARELRDLATNGVARGGGALGDSRRLEKTLQVRAIA